MATPTCTGSRSGGRRAVLGLEGGLGDFALETAECEGHQRPQEEREGDEERRSADSKHRRDRRRQPGRAHVGLAERHQEAMVAIDDAHEVRLFADFMRGMSLGKPMWDTEAAFVPYGERGRPSPETYQSAFWMKFARGVNGTWFYEWAPTQDSPLAFTFYPGGDPVPTIYTIAECSRLLAKHKVLLSKATSCRV